MSVLTEVLKWSADRPMWQRDALRRIITQGYFTENDAESFMRMCLAQHGITDSEHPVSLVPLASEHLPLDDDQVKQVRLHKLYGVQNVDALAQDQEVQFEPNGMTIIFGYNGSGKSGYARILRSLCQARHSKPILSNVFQNNAMAQPAALLEYSSGFVQKVLHWKQGIATPKTMKQVNFFDANCASVHVDEENGLAFTPFGLDILPKLAAACVHIDKYLKDQVKKLQQQKPAVLIDPQISSSSEVFATLQNLDEKSRIEDLIALSDVSEKGTQRLMGLDQLLGPDPISKAKELTGSSGSCMG